MVYSHVASNSVLLSPVRHQGEELSERRMEGGIADETSMSP